MRRFMLGLFLLGLVAAAGWLVLRGLEPKKEAGLVVEVEVVDRHGNPVPNAKIQARYAPGWKSVGQDGRGRLERVLLRAGERATATAVARAIEVEAPSHALALGEAPALERTGKKTWHARIRLAPFGRLRLLIQPTLLPEVRAWIVGDPLLSQVVAEKGIAVARPGQPATWRVFDGVDEVEIRVEGMSGVALRRLVVPAPNAGFTRELLIEAESAAPISGRVVVAAGEVPTRGGRLEIHEVLEDGKTVRQPYDAIVADDGTFEIPFAGTTRYRLVPRLDFLAAESVETKGGTSDLEIVARPLPWLDVKLEDADPGNRRVVYSVVREAGDRPWSGGATWAGKEGAWVAVPGDGRYVVRVLVEGDAAHAPLEGEVRVDVEGGTGHLTPLPLRPAPAGRVLVTHVLDAATVQLLEPAPSRRFTYLPGLGRQPVFENVRAGAVRVLVRWRNQGTAIEILGGTLEPDGTLDLVAQPIPGRRVILEGEGDGVWQDSRDRVVEWTTAGGLDASIRCRRRSGAARWEGVDRIAPGAYRIRVRPLEDSGPVGIGPVGAGPVEFEGDVVVEEAQEDGDARPLIVRIQVR